MTAEERYELRLKQAEDANLSDEQTVQALLPWNASAACRTKQP